MGAKKDPRYAEFVAQYQTAYRVWGAIVRDAIEVVVGAATVSELKEAQNMCRQVLEAYDEAMSKWGRGDLEAAIEGDA